MTTVSGGGPTPNPVSLEPVRKVENPSFQDFPEINKSERPVAYANKLLDTSQTEQARQLVDQKTAKVKTLIRKNGEFHAEYGADGSFHASETRPPVDFRGIQADAESRGLRGWAKADYVGQKIAEGYRERYGDSVEILQFDQANAPTQAEAVVMRSDDLDTVSSYVDYLGRLNNFNSEAMQVLQGIE